MTSSWQGFTIALNTVFDSGVKNLVSSRTLAQLLRGSSLFPSRLDSCRREHPFFFSTACGDKVNIEVSRVALAPRSSHS